MDEPPLNFDAIVQQKEIDAPLQFIRTQDWIHFPEDKEWLTPNRVYCLLYNRGVELMNNGENESALAFFKYCQQINPKCQSYLLSSIIFGRLGKATETLTHLEEKSREELGNSALVLRAILYHNKGAMDESIKDADMVLSRDPNHVTALMIKGDSLKFKPCLNKEYLPLYAKAISLDSKVANYIGKGFRNNFPWYDHLKSVVDVFMKHQIADRYDPEREHPELNLNNYRKQFMEVKKLIYPPPKAGDYKSLFPTVKYGNDGALIDSRDLISRKRFERVRQDVPQIAVEKITENEQLNTPDRSYRRYWDEPHAFRRRKMREKIIRKRWRYTLDDPKRPYPKPWLLITTPQKHTKKSMDRKRHIFMKGKGEPESEHFHSSLSYPFTHSRGIWASKQSKDLRKTNPSKAKDETWTEKDEKNFIRPHSPIRGRRGNAAYPLSAGASPTTEIPYQLSSSKVIVHDLNPHFTIPKRIPDAQKVPESLLPSRTDSPSRSKRISPSRTDSPSRSKNISPLKRKTLFERKRRKGSKKSPSKKTKFKSSTA